MSEPLVFVCVPTYFTIIGNALQGLHSASYKHRFYLHHEMTSLTQQTFNVGWCQCLNHRHQGFTHWAMHHSDIEAPPGWLDVLMDEKERTGADIISTVVPIKDTDGNTSTGVMRPDGSLRRLTMREAMQLPETFGVQDVPWAKEGDQLIVNTGLWLCRLDAWVDECPGFAVLSEVRDDPADPSKKRAFLLSEDWNFSRWAFQRGLKIYATRKVKVKHWGWAFFGNDHAWGEKETDTGGPPAGQDMTKAAKEPVKAKASYYEVAPYQSPKPITREIVAVRYAESMAWVHGWLDEMLVQHGPDLTYRIYDKGPGGNTPNIGNLDWTYLHHIVSHWETLADWTVFTQADPFPHLRLKIGDVSFGKFLCPDDHAVFPFLAECREWGDDGRLLWLSEEWKKNLPDWHRRFINGSIKPARLSMVEWFQEYLGVDINKLGSLSYHPGAVFGVDRSTIQRRPKAFYQRLKESLEESGHPSPEEAHHLERAWPLVFSHEGK